MYDLKTRINNISGQKVITIHNKNFSTTTLCLTFRIGSINDSKGQNGIAYVMFYYMIFNNIDTLNKIKSMSLSYKIEVNREYSIFLIECPHEKYQEALSLSLSIFTNFNNNEEILNTVKQYVIKKYKSNMDNIDFCLNELIHELVFTRQIIGKSVFGKAKTTMNISLIDLHNFYTKYYNNKNILLTISSENSNRNISTVVQEVLEKYTFVEGQFSSFKNTDLIKEANTFIKILICVIVQ